MAHTCGGCTATWTGLSMAHCAARGCHQTFRTVRLFDRHRVKGTCQSPATLLGPSREAAMWLGDDGVWRDNRPRPEFWNVEGAVLDAV